MVDWASNSNNQLLFHFYNLCVNLKCDLVILLLSDLGMYNDIIELLFICSVFGFWIIVQ